MGQLLNVYQQHVIVAERSLFEKIHIETSYKQTSEGILSVLASVPRTQLASGPGTGAAAALAPSPSKV